VAAVRSRSAGHRGGAGRERTECGMGARLLPTTGIEP
jgi:hypothetical protein